MPPEPTARPLLPERPSGRRCASTSRACSTSSSTAAATWRGRFGMAQSGPVDTRAARLANALVGNDPGEPLLELTVRGPSLTALRPVRIAIAGPAVLPWIRGELAEAYATLELATGDRLSLPHTGQGARAYLALAGGIESERFMGSASTDVRGLIGRPLAVGDVLGTAREVESTMRMSARVDWPVDGATVRIMPGPEGDERGARATRRRRSAHRGRRSHGRPARGRRDPGRRGDQRAAAARRDPDHAQRRAVRAARRPLPHGRLREAGGRAPRRPADHRPAAARHARAFKLVEPALRWDLGRATLDSARAWRICPVPDHARRPAVRCCSRSRSSPCSFRSSALRLGSRRALLPRRRPASRVRLRRLPAARRGRRARSSMPPSARR